MLKITQITKEHVQEVVGDDIRNWIGKNRKLTVKEASALTRINDRAIDSYRLDNITPPPYTLIKLWGAIDEPLPINSFLDIIGYGGAHRISGDGSVACPHQIAADLSDGLSHVLEDLRDGKVDHTELPPQLEKLGDLASKLLTYVKKMEG